jgi:hypothetical protein
MVEMNNSDDLIKGIMHFLKNTYDEEIDCETFFEMIDQFVDAKVQGQDLSEVMPLVLRHLDLCRDCLEEYEALISIIEAEEGLEQSTL